ncbi:hypothetical protein B0O99DRAFT_258265 [Bisporella sp. PMI_857]|nr:hypothetical protein B0O99DRAFT_258265 [Bisporella sp. PMI_857]
MPPPLFRSSQNVAWKNAPKRTSPKILFVFNPVPEPQHASASIATGHGDPSQPCPKQVIHAGYTKNHPHATVGCKKSRHPPCRPRAFYA